MAYLANRQPLLYADWADPKTCDLIVLNDFTRKVPPEKRDALTNGGWRLVEAGCAEEFHRFGNLVVYRVLTPPAPNR